jgi:hypothetical protein
MDLGCTDSVWAGIGRNLFVEKPIKRETKSGDF